MLALPGKDLGMHSWFPLRFGSVPGISRLGSVNHGRSDSGNSCDGETDFACSSQIQSPLKSDVCLGGYTGSPSLSGAHSHSS